MRLGLALALLLAAPEARALTGNTAGASAEFLRVGAGARAFGMAEAYGPVAEGADAIYWNPAGLLQLNGPELDYTHTEFLRFFSHDHVAFGYPLRSWGAAIGVSGTFFYQQAQDAVTNTNQAAGSFTSHSEAYTLAFAKAIGVGDDYPARDRDYFLKAWDLAGGYRPLERDNDFWTGSLMLGMAIKAVSETLYDVHGQAFAVDGGALFRPADLSRLSVSAVFRNLGTQERFIQEQEKLPAEFSTGIAYNFLGENHRWLPALEVALPRYGAPYAKIGLEHTLRLGDSAQFATRLGYRTLSAADLGPLTGLTAGVGVRYKRISFDMGFQPMSDLGDVYRAELGYGF
ncbi:MAG TPA: hypothetical protein VNI01_04365 [Elusimicrobiota bacterium]|jgi:hypothetical protein|nr:hypothetical protein [Elusimicrobiota bacterium]